MQKAGFLMMQFNYSANVSLFSSLTGLEEDSPMNLERFQATVDRFTDLKKTLSFPDHNSPGTSPQLPRRAEHIVAQRNVGRKPAGKPGELNAEILDIWFDKELTKTILYQKFTHLLY